MLQQDMSRRQVFGVFGSIAAIAAASGLGLTACGTNSPAGSAAGSGTNASSNLSGTVNCTGATSFQGLIEAAANNFMMENEEVTITIGGGGSGQGLSDVKDGKAQLGRSDVFAEEKLEPEDAKKLKDNQLCVVGIGPVVNAKVDIDNISVDQLRDIFTGKITNWSEVGGSAGTIQVINRKAGSGTRATFESAVLQGQAVPTDFVPAAEEDSSGTVVEKVSQTEGSISYLAFSYFDDSKFKALAVDGNKPTNENVCSGDFGIWAYEHLYCSTDVDATTQAFVDYLLSDEVQSSLVESEGFIPITSMQVKKDAKGNVSAA